MVDRALVWYDQTPALERISWGGLFVCAALGLVVVVERLFRLQCRKVLPAQFVDRFLPRLREGRLDRAKALDLCALNPSPAARICRAALDRWGRSTADMERAVSFVSRVETRGLWRSVGTLRRVAAMSLLLGMLGTLGALSRIFATSVTLPSGPVLSAALNPLISGVGLAIVAFAAYDGLVARVEVLVQALERLGSETVDVLVLIGMDEQKTLERLKRSASLGEAQAAVRTPHLARVERTEAIERPMDESSRGA